MLDQLVHEDDVMASVPSRFEFNHPILKDRRRDLRRRETDAETYLWRKLKNKALQGLKFWRQYSVGPYVLDFYCPSKRLAIELDGDQHAEEESIRYDRERTNYLESKSIRVLRFWNNEILTNREGVLKRILEMAHIPPPR